MKTASHTNTATKATKPRQGQGNTPEQGVFTCAKEFMNFPFAHRQHNHDGHCRLIHGHNWGFKVVFHAQQLDKNQFVIDFGRLGELKEWLNEMFDHTLVLNEDDPELEYLRKVLAGAASIVTVPNCGAEGLAKYILEQINELFFRRNQSLLDRGVQVVEVTVYEDSKNSATYCKPFRI